MPNFSGIWNLKEQVQAIAAGRWTGLPTGEVYAWGDNSPNGQLGDGTVVDRSSPVQVGSLNYWLQVSAGTNHTASITTNNAIYVWGRNNSGQLGDGSVVSKSSPVQVGALTNWSQVSAGANHTASIKTDGTLWTWGQNGNGELGNGTTAYRSSPVQVGALTN